MPLQVPASQGKEGKFTKGEEGRDEEEEGGGDPEVRSGDGGLHCFDAGEGTNLVQSGPRLHGLHEGEQG